MKSGTTALCDSLAKHPDLLPTHLEPGEPQHFTKELHHFDSKVSCPPPHHAALLLLLPVHRALGGRCMRQVLDVWCMLLC
jgi:hypothetical protein